MKLTVRDADVRAERDDLLRVLRAELDGWGDDALYDWLYLQNPEGPARSWTLRDESGAIAGVSTAFPRRLSAGSRAVDAWVLGDFCVLRSLRALGPALQLQRATLEAAERAVDVWYDFPSRSMLAVHRRMGARERGELVRWVRPLKVDHVVEDKLGDGALSRGIARAGNAVLSLRDAGERPEPGWSVRERTEDFDASPGVSAPGDPRDEEDGVRVARTADYLNWRFRRDPREGLRILDALEGGAVRGSLVYRLSPEGLGIVDVIDPDGESAVRALVLDAVGAARRAGAARVSVALSTDHPLGGLFEGLGFHPRGGAPIVVGGRDPRLRDEAPWRLTAGDRDH